MTAPRLEEVDCDTLRGEEETARNTWGPDSEGVRRLLCPSGHMWDADRTDWRFEVVGVWPPAAFIEAYRPHTGPWGEAVGWPRTRQSETP